MTTRKDVERFIKEVEFDSFALGRAGILLSDTLQAIDTLREALDFYADYFSYDEPEGATSMVMCDEGEEARQALSATDAMKKE
jgi:hypothetical protein